MRKTRKGRATRKIGDPNAKAMWGRCRHQVFRDRTKYTRKTKHKKPEDPADGE